MFDDLVKQLEASGDYKVIKRFSPVDHYNELNGAQVKQAIYVDVETTGLDADVDKIIELAMVPFEFDSDGNIYRVLPAYNAFQDPGIPIPEEITKITGISDDMVAGKSISIDKVSELLSSVCSGDCT